MRIGSPSLEQVLVAANLVLVVVLGLTYLTPDPGAAPATAADASPRLLVVVSSASPADAVVGQPIAEAAGGEVLAVTATGLTAAMLAELSQSRPKQVLVIGGPTAVTEATASALGLYSGTVTRLSGVDRYSTAALAATSRFPRPVRHVRILSGDAPPPKVLTQPAEPSSPVLLVERTRIPPSTAAALRELDPDSIDVVGGPGAVSDAVLRQLQRYAPEQVARLP